MGNIEKKIYVFKKMPLFENFSEEDYNFLAEITKVRKYSSGEILVEEGTSSGDFYIVATGKIDISKRMKNNEFKRIAVLGLGDFFGEMSLIDGGLTSAQAKTLTPAVLLVMKQEAFQYIMENKTDLAFRITYQIARLLSQRLRKINEKYSFVSYVHQKFLKHFENES